MSDMNDEVEEKKIAYYRKCRKDIKLLAREQEEMEEEMISISEKANYMRFHAYEHTSNLNFLMEKILSYEQVPLFPQVDKFASTVQRVIELRRDPLFDAFGNDKASTDDNSKAEKDIFKAASTWITSKGAEATTPRLPELRRDREDGKDMTEENFDEDVQELVEHGSDKLHGSFDDTMRKYATVRRP